MALPTFTWFAQGVCLGFGYPCGRPTVAGAQAPLNPWPRSIGAVIRNDTKHYLVEVTAARFYQYTSKVGMGRSTGKQLPYTLGFVSGVTSGVPVAPVASDTTTALASQIVGSRFATFEAMTVLRESSPQAHTVAISPPIWSPPGQQYTAMGNGMRRRDFGGGSRSEPFVIREGEAFAVTYVDSGLDPTSSIPYNPTGAVTYTVTVRRVSDNCVFTYIAPEMIIGIGSREATFVLENQTGSSTTLEVLNVEAMVEATRALASVVGSGGEALDPAVYRMKSPRLNPDGFIVDRTYEIVAHDTNQPLPVGVVADQGGIPLVVFDTYSYGGVAGGYPVIADVAYIRDSYTDHGAAGRHRRIRWGGGHPPSAASPANFGIIEKGRALSSLVASPGEAIGVGVTPTMGYAVSPLATTPSGLWSVGDVEFDFVVRPRKGLPYGRTA